LIGDNISHLLYGLHTIYRSYYVGYRQYIAVIIWVVENISQLLRTDNQDEWSPVLLDKNMEIIRLMISGHFIRNTVHPSIHPSM
jgi:hypothetical protein